MRNHQIIYRAPGGAEGRARVVLTNTQPCSWAAVNTARPQNLSKDMFNKVVGLLVYPYTVTTCQISVKCPVNNDICSAYQFSFFFSVSYEGNYVSIFWQRMAKRDRRAMYVKKEFYFCVESFFFCKYFIYVKY